MDAFKKFRYILPACPWIDTGFNPADALITCHVNGELKQMASTRDMVFNVMQLVAFISSVMTLEPGDVILSGTPAGVSPIKPFDVVEVTIEGLGKLRNAVRAEPAH
jgi:2-keto-4-pentenoate hydratase/2-oxohepta-3-ene-1,7-dioic acid hydratase in catechol pathway